MNALTLLLVALVAMSFASANMLGGRKSIDIPPNKDVLDAAHFIGSHLKGEQHGASVRVISGTQQVVAGML